MGMGDFAGEAVVGLLLAIPSLLIAYWSYRRSKQSDEASTPRGDFAAQVEGFDKIIGNLERDNADVRARNDALQKKVDTLEGDVRTLGVEVRTVLQRVVKLERFIVDAGLAIPKNGG